MTRPLRLEFPGAIYHVTARGDRRGTIYHDECDREAWLEILGAVCMGCNFVVHAYCQMTNHYHLMVETVEGNLSQGMRRINGLYTQQINRRHGLVGHVLQGRYKAILVQKETYLLTLARYVVLNPVRAGMVGSPDHWQWSSHRFTLGEREAPDWLDTDWLLQQFAESRDEAISRYREFVLDGIGETSPLLATQHQLLLGDDAFVAAHRNNKGAAELTAIAKVQRRMSALSLDQYQRSYASRDEAVARAYWSTAYTMVEIGAHFGVGYSTVSRAVRRFADAAARWV
jgi:REP element-mobilizing transposase RayT